MWRDAIIPPRPLLLTTFIRILCLIANNTKSKIGYNSYLTDIIQIISSRLKEPLRKQDAIILIAIHIPKDLELDIIRIVGLAKKMPSCQSYKKDEIN